MIGRSVLAAAILFSQGIEAAPQKPWLNPCLDKVRQTVQSMRFDRHNAIVSNNQPVTVREITRKGNRYEVMAVQRDRQTGEDIADFFASVKAEKTGSGCRAQPATLLEIVK